MGVMACDRRDCENIMCDEYSTDFGYICYECKTELEESNPKSYSDVQNFMSSSKNDSAFLDDNGEFNLDLVFSTNR